jgi:hypothetical protein
MRTLALCNCFVPSEIDDDCQYSTSTMKQNNNKNVNKKKNKSSKKSNAIYTVSNSSLDLTLNLRSCKVSEFGGSDLEIFRRSSCFLTSKQILNNNLRIDSMSMDSGFMSNTNLSPYSQSKFDLNNRAMSNELFLAPTPLELDEFSIIEPKSVLSFQIDSSSLTINKNSNNNIMSKKQLIGHVMMPFFFEWSKNSLNRVKSSMMKFLFISKIKENVSINEQIQAASPVKAIENNISQEENQLKEELRLQDVISNEIKIESNDNQLVKVIKLFTNTGLKAFNEHFFSIYDTNFF